MAEYKNRNEVPKKYRCDLSDFFENDAHWEQIFEETKKSIKNFKKFQNQSLSAKMVEEFLKENIHIYNQLMDLYVYSYISHDVDLEADYYLEMKSKIIALYTEYEKETAFFEPLLIGLTKKEFDNLFIENKTLENYRVLLEEIYSLKEHILSEKEEKIITALTDTFNSYATISSSLINSEHDYGKIKLDDGKIVQIAANNLYYLRQNKNDKIRKTAYQKFGKVIQQYQNTESSLLNNYVRNNVNIAHLRNYKSAWDAKLEKIHISNDVFENLKQTGKKYKKSWQKYFNLIKSNLNLKELHNYDTVLDWTDTDKNYSIEDAQKIILEALGTLGDDYKEKVKTVFDNHYIDYCQYKGKVSGGYSIANDTHNSRILLNFNGSYDDILIIAHEIGHNVHQQYVNIANPVWYRDTSIFVAEVASLTNEFILNSYLAKYGKTKEEQLLGMEHTLKTFQNNFFDAIMEAEIEQKMYDHVENGNIITASYLNNLVKESKKEYLGNVIKSDKYKNLSWVTRSHYYTNFYLYSYALCVSVASIVARKILNHEKGFLEKYKAFLSCGSDMYPEQIYETLGIHLKDKNVFEEAILFFENQMEEYQKVKEGVNNG